MVGLDFAGTVEERRSDAVAAAFAYDSAERRAAFAADLEAEDIDRELHRDPTMGAT